MKHDIKHVVRSIDHYVSQQNIYIAYQLLITRTILITIKEGYLISKIVNHFKYGQNQKNEELKHVFILLTKTKVFFFQIRVISDSYVATTMPNLWFYPLW